MPISAFLALSGAFVALPVSAQGALGDRLLERGDRGQDVRDLQRALGRLGHDTDVDGQFGPGTERAVRSYERKEAIKVDGAVSGGQGKGMARRVEERSGKGERDSARSEQTAFGRRTLTPGDRGPGVQRLQTVLTGLGYRVSSDGIFGRGTESNVRGYERDEKITVDGEVSGGQARGMKRRLEERGPVAEPRTERAPAQQTPAQPAPAGTADGWFPIAGSWSFGGDGAGFDDRGGAHKGEDVFAACGTPLVAAQSGTVVFKSYQERAGHYAVIRGAQSGQDLVYMHLQAPATVERGQAVRARQPIGAVGDSGNARGCHLHFEMWTAPGWYEGGSPFDPRPSLERWAQSTRAAIARR